MPNGTRLAAPPDLASAVRQAMAVLTDVKVDDLLLAGGIDRLAYEAASLTEQEAMWTPRARVALLRFFRDASRRCAEVSQIIAGAADALEADVLARLAGAEEREASVLRLVRHDEPDQAPLRGSTSRELS